MDVEPTLPTKRHVIIINHFDENNLGDDQNQYFEELVRLEYILVVVDKTFTSLERRFEQLKNFESIF